MSPIIYTQKVIKTCSILLLFVFSVSSFYAQNKKANFNFTEFNSSLHNKIYKIKIDDYQAVELIEFKNGEYSGSLTNSIWKINLTEGPKKQIIQKIDFSNTMAKSILNECYTQDIETLPSCENVKGYIVGQDGIVVTITIKSNLINRSYSYWEPENDSYQNSEIKEVKNIRNILNAVNNEFNLTRTFDKFIDGLSTGEYAYGVMVLEKRQKPM